MTKSDQRPGRNRKLGLDVNAERFAEESTWFRRLFPELSARLAYFMKGRRKNRQWREGMRAFMAKSPPPWFRHVEVETLNRCNGGCEFCPVNRNAAQRPLARMSEVLFEDILRQLAAIRYHRGLSLYSNNEPLLDTRLPEFAALARERLPDAYLQLYTNGTLLTLDLFRTLMPHFDKLTINNYSLAPKMHDNVREIHDYCLTPEGQRLIAGKFLHIQLRNPTNVLSSRAGVAPNRNPPAQPVSALCMYPFSQFIVRPDGRVSLCCNDALGQMTLGDLTRQSMAEIWRGEACTRIRAAMIEKGRVGIPVCARCDFVDG